MERTEKTRDIRGYDAVKLWRRFERGDEDALDVLLEYNRQDVENLVPLMHHAYRNLRARFLGTRPPATGEMMSLIWTRELPVRMLRVAAVAVVVKSEEV